MKRCKYAIKKKGKIVCKMDGEPCTGEQGACQDDKG
jgi:hypothetical protein